MAIKYLDSKRIRGSSTAATSGKIAGTSGTGSVFAKWTRTAGTVNNGRDNLSYDLGATLNDTQWIMRFKLYIDTISLGSGSGCQIAFGMSDADADTAYETNQDSISFRIQFASGSSEQKFVSNNSNGGEMGTNDSVILDWSSASPAGKTFYVQIKRTGTTAGTVSITENSDYTTSATTVNMTNLSASTTGLRYFVAKEYDGQSGAAANFVYGSVTDVKIYDNQSSPTTVTYDINYFMRQTSGWNINSGIQNIVPIEVDEKATLIGTSAGSCKFAGAGDTLSIGSSTTALTPADFTIAFWYKPISVSSPSVQRIYHNGGTGSEKIEIQVYNDNIYATVGSGSAIQTTDLVNGTAEHWVITNSSGTITAYRDNVQDGTGSGGATRNDTASGKAFSHSSEGLNGYLGDFVLTTDVITESERSDLANGYMTPSALDNKVLYFPFTANLNESVSSYNGTAGGDTAIDTSVGFTVINLPENTLFEETDTYKTWWLQGAKWIPMTTYSGVDSTWQNSGSGSDFTIDAANNEVDYHNAVNAKNVYFDLNSIQTLSTSKWLIRYAVTQTGTSSGGNGNTSRIFHGVSETGVTYSNSTSTDFVGYSIDTTNGAALLRPHLIQCDDRVLHTSTSGSGSGHQASFPSPADSLSSNGTKYYYELSRDGANYTGSIYSDSDYSTLLGSRTHTMPNEALRYFIFCNYVDGGGISGVLSDFKYYNGISEF